MIHSIKISGYRALSKFEMHGLGQINLLVGKNNTGKTSVLETLYLLASSGDPAALWRIMTRRGEQLAPDATTGRNPQQELDVCHLFYGHEIKFDTTARIVTANQKPARSIEFRITEAKREENPTLFAQIPPENERPPGSARLSMSIKGNPNPVTPLVPLSSRGGLRPEVFQLLNNMASSVQRVEASSPQYISTESISVSELMALYNTIALTPHEERVLSALQFIEPNLERIAIAPSGPIFPGFPMRGGFKAKLKNFEQPVPIGSLGDGIWRMLALAITLSRSKDNLLLIDEIDTGLHYTVMASMWKLIYDTAKSLNVQVFATTHSSDCVKSLASICRDEVRIGSQITIQRIESGNSEAVPYTEAEIAAATKDNIEMR